MDTNTTAASVTASQPEALRLAEILGTFYSGIGRIDATAAAAELRRLHALTVATPATQEAQHEALLKATIAFVLEQGGYPPPPPTAPPETFEEYHAFVDLVQAITAPPRAADSLQGAPIVWPKARDVGRIGDMSPSASLRVGLDSDNDVFVSVWGEDGGGSVEFCNGGGGGGRSMRTRLALIALMVAMEQDNAERPDLDWWALRMGGSKQEGGGA